MVDTGFSRSIFLSREVSHFLLNAWMLQDHPEMDLAKRTTFAAPAVDALIINEALYLDPAVGLYGTRLTQILADNNPILSRLRQDSILRDLPLSTEEYIGKLGMALDQTRDFLLRSLSEHRPLGPYNYFHFLESPLSMFIRETDRLLNRVRTSSPEINAAWSGLRGIAPFVLSVFLSVEIYKELGLPTLSSTLALPIAREISLDELVEVIPDRNVFIREMIDSLVATRAGWPSGTQTVPVPNFTKICEQGCSNSAELIERAIDLRNDKNCDAFRRELWRIFDDWCENPVEPISKRAVTRLFDASAELVLSVDSSLMNKFARSTFNVLLMTPLWLIDPIFSTLGKLGFAFAKDFKAHREAASRFAWLFFIYENLQMPKGDVGSR
jgi:hypothetical protein